MTREDRDGGARPAAVPNSPIPQSLLLVGNPLQVRDGKGNIRVTEFNGLNLPWKQYDPAPFNANYVETLYDKNGKPTSNRDRRGNVTTSHYDALGRVDLVTDPAPFNAQTIVTTYDKVGNVRTVKDKRNIVSETIYDDLYRVSEQKRDGVRLVSNEYDDASNLTASVDAEDNRIAFKTVKRDKGTGRDRHPRGDFRDAGLK